MIRIRRSLAVVAALVAAVAVFAMVGSSSLATGQVTNSFSISAATFASRNASTNDGACGDPVPPSTGEENRGSLSEATGSFLAPVHLPQGAVIERLSLYVHDFTDPADAHAFLVRKKIADGIGYTSGYLVMGVAESSGFEDSERRFTDRSIKNGVVDNSSFAYFVELVNCDSTIQPIAVEVVYTTV